MIGMPGVAAGAVVKATVASGQTNWNGELCDVERVFLMHSLLVAECRSWWTPSVTCVVPVNEVTIELVAPPVPEVKP